MSAADMTHGWQCPVCNRITVQYLEPHYCAVCGRSQRHRMIFTELTLDGLAAHVLGDSDRWQHDTTSHRSRYWHESR